MAPPFLSGVAHPGSSYRGRYRTHISNFNILFQGNEIVIELNEKLAKLQLTISKQTQTIKQLEKDKKALELTITNKCGGQSENVAIGEQSNYPNPLCKMINSKTKYYIIVAGTNTTTKNPVKSTTQTPTVLKTGKQLKSNCKRIYSYFNPKLILIVQPGRS